MKWNGIKFLTSVLNWDERLTSRARPFYLFGSDEHNKWKLKLNRRLSGSQRWSRRFEEERISSPAGFCSLCSLSFLQLQAPTPPLASIVIQLYVQSVTFLYDCHHICRRGIGRYSANARYQPQAVIDAAFVYHTLVELLVSLCSSLHL